MKMPGFTAEETLCGVKGKYHIALIDAAFTTQVIPQVGTYFCWKAGYICDRYGYMCDAWDRYCDRGI